MVQGGTKLILNVYRGWIGEYATLDLRHRVRLLSGPASDGTGGSDAIGIRAAMVVSEVEPIGGFVGGAISEPLLEGGTLVSVVAYMVHVNWPMGLSVLVLFVPQLIFVPLMQRGVNRRTKVRVKIIRRLSISVVGHSAEDKAEADARRDEERIERVFHLNVGILKLKFTMNLMMNLCTKLQYVAALLVGGWMVHEARLEVGGIVAFISGISKLVDPWGDLVNYFRDVNLNLVKYRLARDAIDHQLAEPGG